MSFFDTIKGRLITHVAGVTVHFTRNEEQRISYVLLRKRRNKTKIVHSGTDLSSFDELVGKLEKNTPVWLSVTGRTIISKKLDNDPKERYLNHLLPNAREDEFLVNVVSAGENSVFISAIRFDQFNQLTDALRKAGFPVLGYSLGVTSLSFLYQLNLIKDSKVEVPGYILTTESGEVSEIKLSEKVETSFYSVGGAKLDSRIILAFSTALAYMINHSGVGQVTNDLFVSDEDNYVYKRMQHSITMAALVILFQALLINFYVFSYFNDKHQSLSDELSYQKVFFSQKDSLQKEINFKTSLVNQMGLADNTKYGYFVDRIAATVPASVTLNKMIVNPLTEKVKINQPVEYKKFVVIEGESSGSIVLNQWVNTLDTFAWIKDIEIVRYEKTGRNGEFELKILY